MCAVQWCVNSKWTTMQLCGTGNAYQQDQFVVGFGLFISGEQYLKIKTVPMLMSN